MSPNRFTAPGLARRRSTPPARAPRTRGQSLVEFALVIPILLFLTLIALDFGRVYLGYINLQNMARIAANFAATTRLRGTRRPTPSDAELKLQVPTRSSPMPRRSTASSRTTATGIDASIPARPSPTATGNGFTVRPRRHRRGPDRLSFGVITPGHRQRRRRQRPGRRRIAVPGQAGMTAVGTGGGGPAAPAQCGIQRQRRHHLLARLDHRASPRSTSSSATRRVATRRSGRGRSRTDGTTSTSQDPLNHTFTTAGHLRRSR